jgi:hypothetical protein
MGGLEGGGERGGAGAFGCWPFTPRVLGSQTSTPVNLIFFLLLLLNRQSSSGP